MKNNDIDFEHRLRYLPQFVVLNAGKSGSGGGGGGVQSVTATDSSIVISGTATNPTVGLPYKVYVALLNQTGTSDPVATILENTFSGVTFTWTRDSAGVYRVTCNGTPFTTDKTTVFLTPININFPDCFLISVDVINTNHILPLYTVDLSGAGGDDLLVNTAIEIRVYS